MHTTLDFRIHGHPFQRLVGHPSHLQAFPQRRCPRKAYVGSMDHWPVFSKAEIHAFGVVPNVRRNISTKALD
jgi:hypothetical protein